jgi:glycosyltransferase involved in cell wall biosynthesis
MPRDRDFDSGVPITYLYFGTDWEAENRTSAHHVARWLGGRAQLRYFECPGLRAPKTTGRDIRRMGAKLAGAFKPARTPAPQVEVRTLLQLPFRRLPGVHAFNRWWLRRSVRRVAADARRQGGAVVSWFAVPHVGALAGQVGEDLVVQYCVDDYSALPDVDAADVAAMDAALSRRADLVFVTSATLLERKRQLARHVAVAPHGVDVAHFRRAADEREAVPDDIRELPGPVIGFFGLIEAWIDLDLVAELAARHPDWQFVLIGRVAVPASALPTQANLHFLGRRPYESLPSYGRRFDVSIIPYRMTTQVHHANPIKLREYLAMEKPIVAVSTPEIDKFADVVTIARTVDEWDAALVAALVPGDRRAERAAMRAAADAMTWDARLHRVESIVTGALAGRPFAPPPVSR